VPANVKCIRLDGVERAEFEELVRDALDGLPEGFARHLENVEVVVEDDPSPQLLRSLGLHPQRDTLFGLYQGVPLNLRGATFGGMLPDKISIFYHPLVRAFRTPDGIRRQVRKTVIHEIGHFFGLDDKTIRDLGY
jgi:predicted Zn-dependent protease with MMP-like domain